MGQSSLCTPCFSKAADILCDTFKYLSKPFKIISDKFWRLNNASLYFCGFSIILVPLIAVFWIALLSILCVEFFLLASLGILLGIIFILVGIWPAFLISAGITGIAIIRLPWNIFYHCLVTYRTVMLRPNVKIVSFLLLPIIHLLIPPFTLLTALLTLTPWFTAISFAGYPTKPWQKIEPFHQKFWKKFVSDVNRFARNFGHPSGIPQDWDGTVYGLPIDPITVIISSILYLVSAIPVSLGVLLIFTIKAMPIFLGTLLEFWKTMNLSTALQWYQRVVTGHQREGPTPGSSQAQPSGHAVWSSEIKKYAKKIKKSIEGYCEIKFFNSYAEIIQKHQKRIKHLDPNKLGKLITSFLSDFSPMRLAPSDAGIGWVVLWIPLLLSSIFWILGLLLVLTIPPATFLLGFAAWLLAWVPVFFLPPVLYILGWLLIIFGIPVLYLLLWILILVCPWLVAVLGAVSGPFLSLKIPFAVIKNDFYNPIEMWSSMKRGIIKIPVILKEVDHFTAKLSIGKLKFTEEDISRSQENRRTKINYWDLFVIRCKTEAQEVQIRGWISIEDLQAVSPTSLIAIPGSTILSILEDSILKSGKDKTLIYWNEEAQCTDATRDLTDNVANLFWPRLIKVKAGLMEQKDLKKSTMWIRASLCDGEDEKSQELDTALRDLSGENSENKRSLRIRSEVENVVHALLRVQGLSSRLPEIFDL